MSWVTQGRALPNPFIRLAQAPAPAQTSRLLRPTTGTALCTLRCPKNNVKYWDTDIVALVVSFTISHTFQTLKLNSLLLLIHFKNKHYFCWQPWSRDHMNNPLGWFYSMKELWSMGMISILEIFKSTPVKTSHFSSSDSEAAPICFCFSQSLWVSEINQGSLLRHRMKDRQHIRTHHSLTLWGKWFKHSVPKIFVTSCLRYKMEIFFEKIIDICPSGVSSVSCKLELACGVTLCLLDWPTLIIKPHWASESNINLGENWLTTSQGTGWPQSYWYLNNLCIFIATTKHCGQKSGQTRDKQLFWFSCHLIARHRQSHDSDCHVSLCVWPLSWCPHLQPDTGTLLRRKREKSIWFLSLFYSMGSELVRWQELWTKYHKHISELITSNTFYWYLTLNQATSRSRHLFFQ